MCCTGMRNPVNIRKFFCFLDVQKDSGYKAFYVRSSSSDKTEKYEMYGNLCKRQSFRTTRIKNKVGGKDTIKIQLYRNSFAICELQRCENYGNVEDVLFSHQVNTHDLQAEDLPVTFNEECKKEMTEEKISAQLSVARKLV